MLHPAADVPATIRSEQVWDLLRSLPDPEIPVVSVVDLGMIRDVTVHGDTVEVAVAPTYSGCPATEVIEQGIMAVLQKHGIADVRLRRVLSPPWTTAWISTAGRAKLLACGIAPPDEASSKRSLTGAALQVACPRCSSPDTQQVSEFGSTPCKASYKCRHCLEPFEYFKCI